MENQEKLDEIQRIIVYVDGFNLYFGLKDSGFSKLKWLNIHSLCESILRQNQKLMNIKYFTSIVNTDAAKIKRQTVFIDALKSTNIQIFYGKYKKKEVSCNFCRSRWDVFTEKMTDVNIATQMLIDAFKDSYDTAVLISGDTDLVPPITAIKELFPSKKVFTVFPPNRSNNELKNVSSGTMTIGESRLRDHQFPNVIVLPNGFKLIKPLSW